MGDSAIADPPHITGPKSSGSGEDPEYSAVQKPRGTLRLNPHDFPADKPRTTQQIRTNLHLILVRAQAGVLGVTSRLRSQTNHIRNSHGFSVVSLIQAACIVFAIGTALLALYLVNKSTSNPDERGISVSTSWPLLLGILVPPVVAFLLNSIKLSRD